ncbi:MAG TPA: hypothetical protein VGO43_08805 [Pyrinomonadaceae bacterium]|jgi:hypothetical protein|nr:hypothetical protein [Pyrinomonadaceae bacterium]
MSNFIPRTLDQNKRIHGLAGQNGVDRDTLHAHACEISNKRTSRTSELSFDEANVLIKRLGGEPLPASSGLSTRSQQRARQKAGVKQLRTKAQEKMILDLWANDPVRTMSGLETLSKRILKGKSQPSTTDEANKLIEAIKSMNRRPRRNASPSIGRAA